MQEIKKKSETVVKGDIDNQRTDF